MAETKAKTPTLVDLERLTQKQAAWLLGKPAVWLRDNAHLSGCNVDGTYNARDLVAATRGVGEGVAELDDATLEAVQQLVESNSFEVDYPSVAVKLVERIKSTHGTAGLAAIGEAYLAELRHCHEVHGDKPLPEIPDPDDVRDDFAKRAEQHIAQLQTEQYRAAGRAVLQCQLCGRYRWGRTWRKGAPPAKYAVTADECPRCLSKAQ